MDVTCSHQPRARWLCSAVKTRLLPLAVDSGKRRRLNNNEIQLDHVVKLTLSRNLIGQSATTFGGTFSEGQASSEHILGCWGGAASCTMAECMEEFDEATPLKESYCSRLTPHEYEEQADRWAPIRIHASLEVFHFMVQLYGAGTAGANGAAGYPA